MLPVDPHRTTSACQPLLLPRPPLPGLWRHPASPSPQPSALPRLHPQPSSSADGTAPGLPPPPHARRPLSGSHAPPHPWAWSDVVASAPPHRREGTGASWSSPSTGPEGASTAPAPPSSGSRPPLHPCSSLLRLETRPASSTSRARPLLGSLHHRRPGQGQTPPLLVPIYARAPAPPGPSPSTAGRCRRRLLLLLLLT
jgi:hypothetical protein